MILPAESTNPVGRFFLHCEKDPVLHSQRLRVGGSGFKIDVMMLIDCSTSRARGGQ